MLSVARYRLILFVRLAFLGVHSVGSLLGIVYRSKTPNLYKNNAHNKVGWLLTGIILAQCVLEIVKFAASIGKSEARSEEQEAFLHPVSEKVMQHEQTHAYRYSNGSGHFTASESSRSQSVSSMMDPHKEEQEQKLHAYKNPRADVEADCTEKLGLLCQAKLHRFTLGVPANLSRKTIHTLNVMDSIINSISLLLGFVAIISGAVVYGGVFRGNSIFNGMAHSVKGGIFFWYGLLTLGRWMGCFADMGWAWNVKPPVGIVNRRVFRMPSAEFVESFVIFLYGVSNVWLEHLAAWGSAWSAQDYEHVSISILFFGGGLCGMLVESEKVRNFLNTTIVASATAHRTQRTGDPFLPPKSYASSMNPFPALIIFLLGLLMSSHDQSSMVSTTIHKQWGTLFVGFALARAITYIMIYISPPTSYLPSRPPSELISSFCLISGGLVFIVSNKDTVAAMEDHDIHAMFPFTIIMGFTAFLMAWVIITLAIKGWALRKTRTPTSRLSAAEHD
jgi:cytochrome b561